MPPKKKIPPEKPKSLRAKKTTDSRESVLKSDVLEEEEYVPVVETKKSTPYMSIYEYTALIRARALQLGGGGGEPKISLNPENPEEYDPINIATKEVDMCLITLLIRRTLIDGTTEDWHPKDMIYPRK